RSTETRKREADLESASRFPFPVSPLPRTLDHALPPAALPPRPGALPRRTAPAPHLQATPPPAAGERPARRLAVREHARPPAAGPFIIVVLGERRFEVRGLLPEDAPYLVAAVEEFGDAADSAPPPEERHELEAVAERLRRALAILSDAGEELPAWEAEPEAFSFQAAALLEADPEVGRASCRE